MKIGSVIYSTNSGLGILAKEFYDAGVLHNVLVEKHPRYENYFNRYQDANIVGPHGSWNTCNWLDDDNDKFEEFIENTDILLVFEIPFYNRLLDEFKKRNKKIVWMPMWECTPVTEFHQADGFLAVSDIESKILFKMFSDLKPIKRINVPTHSKIKFQKRDFAQTFVHNDGNGSSLDRNGTDVLLQAMRYVKSPISLQIRSQKRQHRSSDERVEIINQDIKFADLWSSGDVFIFPERWNGLSLPIQEACGSGMAIMCGDRFPLNKWLPKDILIPTEKWQPNAVCEIIPGQKFPFSIYDPKKIAESIDGLYGKNIEKYSKFGKEWGERNHWSVLKPQYLDFLESILYD